MLEAAVTKPFGDGSNASVQNIFLMLEPELPGHALKNLEADLIAGHG